MKTKKLGIHYLSQKFPHSKVRPPLSAAQQAIKDYRKNYENGDDRDNPERPFPAHGLETSKELYYNFISENDYERGYPTKDCLDKKKRHWHIIKCVDIDDDFSQCIEGFYEEPDYTMPNYKEGEWIYEEDKWIFVFVGNEECDAWMLEKTMNYLYRTSTENPQLYKREIADLKRHDPHNVLPQYEQWLLRTHHIDVKGSSSSSQMMPPTTKLNRENKMSRLGLYIDYDEFSTESGKVKILRRVDEDDYTLVWKGYLRNQDVTVVVKELRLQNISEYALTTLKQEKAMMMGLWHLQHVVRLEGVCLSPYALVMEYMPGGSLFDLLHSQKTLPLSMRLKIMLDIGEGVALLHSQTPPILHRDLKSENILLTEDGQAKLADFGLSTAHYAEASQTDNDSQEIRFVGTLAWMAPEIFQSIPKYSEKSDIYAYAMVLWEIIARKSPYATAQSRDDIELPVTQGQREKIPNKSTNPEETIPNSLKQLVNSCWFSDPKKRPTAEQAIDKLSSCQIQIESQVQLCK